MKEFMRPVYRWAALGALAAGVAGCGSAQRADDPLADLRNPKLGATRRVAAIERAWSDANQGRVDKTAVREDLKTIAWGTSYPVPMRTAALKALLEDADAPYEADTRAMVRLMLPREPDRAVVAMLSAAAAQRGWKEVTPSLVRSLSRYWADAADERRPEYRALAKLNPDRTVPLVVYDVFLDPPKDEPAFGSVPAERVRADAWDLLSRLDAGGELRSRLINEASDDGGPTADMRAALRDLRTLPLTGDELRWLTSLRNPGDARKVAWWQEVASVVAGLDPARSAKLQLRHAEPMRWAAHHRPDWLKASRQDLLAEVRSRLQERPVHRRSRRDRDRIAPAPERLADWEPRLSWADLLSILVLDEGLRDPAVRRALFAQAAMDREDGTAEYGGLLRADAEAPGAPFLVVLYPPRPGTRQGDEQFVASTDMIAQSDHALAHYHFHVQRPRNRDYAGPSPNDLAYAARHGRNCLVLTSVGTDSMDVDYYQPDGVVIDLGEVGPP